jgi:hypothetical protein
MKITSGLSQFKYYCRDKLAPIRDILLANNVYWNTKLLPLLGDVHELCNGLQGRSKTEVQCAMLFADDMFKSLAGYQVVPIEAYGRRWYPRPIKKISEEEFLAIYIYMMVSFLEIIKIPQESQEYREVLDLLVDLIAKPRLDNEMYESAKNISTISPEKFVNAVPRLYKNFCGSFGLKADASVAIAFCGTADAILLHVMAVRNVLSQKS